MKRKIINPVIKDTVTFIKTSAETTGRVSELEITLMPGGGNELHYHETYSEQFTAIEGPLELKTGKNTSKILKPGESYTVNPREVHAFYNSTNKEIKFRVEIKPGSKGFEYLLRILYGLAEDGLVNKKGFPKNLRHIAIIAVMSDTKIPGFLSLIFPIFRWIAKRAKASGEEQRLIEKYCT